MKPVGKRRHYPLPTIAWAAVNVKTGKILRDLHGHYGIYTHRVDAQADCPVYGKVRQVRISLINTR